MRDDIEVTNKSDKTLIVGSKLKQLPEEIQRRANLRQTMVRSDVACKSCGRELDGSEQRWGTELCDECFDLRKRKEAGPSGGEERDEKRSKVAQRWSMASRSIMNSRMDRSSGRHIV